MAALPSKAELEEAAEDVRIALRFGREVEGEGFRVPRSAMLMLQKVFEGLAEEADAEEGDVN